MNEREGEYIRYTQEIIGKLCKGNGEIAGKSGRTLRWKMEPAVGIGIPTPRFKEAVNRLSADVEEVTHYDYRAVMLEHGYAVVSGRFRTRIKNTGVMDSSLKTYHIYLAVCMGEIKMLEIIPDYLTGKQIELRDIDKEIRFLWEDEIVYIESQHNHLYWHCQFDVIKTVGTLSEVERSLSKLFVRIHRSYIVNRNKVERVKRFEAIMNNGAILQIPSKKYTHVREKLCCIQ